MRHTTRLLALLATTSVLAAVPAWAEDTPTAPTPSAEDLIQRLGADDFKTREDAECDLAAMGTTARAALEGAAKDDKSPEVRSRAKRILRDLDQDQSSPTTRSPWDDLQRRLTELQGVFDALRRRMESAWGLEPVFPGLPSGRVEAPGLSLERDPSGQVELRVCKEEGTGDGAPQETFRGEGRDDILRREPGAANHSGVAELRERLAADPFALFPELPGMGWKVTSSQGVEIRQGPDRTTVTIREKGADGREQVRTLEGKNLADIKAKHPEIASKLGDVTWSHSLGGDAANRVSPTPQAGQAAFGIRYRALDSALSGPLGVEPGVGLLLVAVEPGSQAEAMGLRAHDVLVKVNGSSATAGSTTREALRRAALDRSALTIEIIRAARREVLSR